MQRLGRITLFRDGNRKGDSLRRLFEKDSGSVLLRGGGIEKGKERVVISMWGRFRLEM